MTKPASDDLANIHKLYPELSDEELRRAEEHLDAYLAVIVRMSQRLEQDPAAKKRVIDDLRQLRRQEKKLSKHVQLT
jgi:hypothetical protein